MSYKIGGVQVSGTTVREALEANSPIRTCIDDHAHWDNNCHQCTASLAQHELNDRHAPKVEAALRAGIEEALDWVLPWDAKVFHENKKKYIDAGVTAGIEKLHTHPGAGTGETDDGITT